MTDLSNGDIARYFDARESELLDPKRRLAVGLDAGFKSALPEGGGTYTFFHREDVFYVGETTSLRQRLAVHMRNPENHVLLLKIARLLYDQEHGSGAAGKTKKFAEDHKKLARRWVRDNLRVAFVPLLIGRKELEERLVSKHKPPFNERYPLLPGAGAHD